MNPKNIIILFFLAVSIVIFSACPGRIGPGYKYNHGKIPEIVTNFEEINSEYDDYNLSSPYIGDLFPLIFSSNRNSQGGQFDYVYKPIVVNFNKETADFSVSTNNNAYQELISRFSNIPQLLQKVNSPQNEYGPYLIEISPKLSRDYGYVLVYTYEENDDMDIKYFYSTEKFKSDTSSNLKWVNTKNNEGYPSFYKNYSKMVYCSDEKGNFNIYEISTGIDSATTKWNNIDSVLIKSLNDTLAREKTLLSKVSSTADDKCPFIDTYNTYYDYNTIKSIMVFTSNREGGYGGYDLYYSKYIDGEWSKPVNMGAEINSPYDEYRPILRKNRGFDNDFLMFSSNRPGGKGGFDIYYIGVDFN